jgi:RNA polymerase sigma-70 factor (ECF subfamily)
MTEQVCASADARLVADIQNGVTQAETALYERYAAKVYYLALRELRSRHDAEDARAETFLRVLQAIRCNQVRSAAALPAFIVGTTRNVVREFFSRRQRAGNTADSSEIEVAVPSHEKMFLDDEVRKAVEETIVRLKQRERDVLRMLFYEELPPEEIARRSGIARERIRLVKSRALKHFREVYIRLERATKAKKL